MPDDNPFSLENTSTGFDNGPRSDANNRRLLIGLAVFAGGLFICGGMGTILVAPYALNTTGIELSPRLDAFASDAAEFNRTLGNPPTSHAVPGELNAFLVKTLDESVAGVEIPLDCELFIEAIEASEYCPGSLAVADRLAIRSWLRQYVPHPSAVEQDYQIAGVRVAPSEDLATVDLLFYSNEDQVESYQWFLARRQRQWRIYDWQRMEYGRRISDEYASFVIGSKSEAPGYDNAMRHLGESVSLWEQGDHDLSRQAIRMAENTKMLAADRPTALLRSAYSWIFIGEYREALRVLAAIESPDQMWGVWPCVAVCHINLDQVERAREAVLRAHALAPHHPNVNSLLGEVHSRRNEDRLAASAFAAALAHCPRSSWFLEELISCRDDSHAGTVIDLVSSIDEEFIWRQLINSAAHDSDWARALVTFAEENHQIPDGAVPLLRGQWFWSRGLWEDAGSAFAKATEVVSMPFLADIAVEDHIAARMEEDAFDKLFVESGDLSNVMTRLLKQAFYDDFYADPAMLRDAILDNATARALPISSGILGWCHHALQQYGESQMELERFLRWLQQGPVEVGKDVDWLSETADYYLADCLLQQDLPLDVLSRWPNDREQHWNLGDHLMRSHDARLRNQFLAHTASSEIHSVRLQRSRLLACIARATDDAGYCESEHRQAIAVARELFGHEDEDRIDQLVRQYARDLVWLRRSVKDVASLFEGDDGDRLIGEFLIEYAREATRLLDLGAVEDLLDSAARAGCVDGDIHASLMHHLADSQKARGDLKSALSSLRDSFEHTSRDHPWLYGARYRRLLDELLRRQRWLEARELCAQLPPDEAAIPAETIVDFAAGLHDDVVRKLKQASTDDASQWLDSEPVVTWLQRSAKVDWLSSFFDQFTPSIRSRHAQSAGQLLFSQSAAFDIGIVQQEMETLFGDDVDVTPISVRDEAVPLRAWLATSDHAGQILISWTTRRYHTQHLPESLAASLAQPVHCLGMAILDEASHADLSLFTLASRVAGKNASAAVAFQWITGAHVWWGENLANQLRVDGRIPVNPRKPNVVLQVDMEDMLDDSEYVDIETWKQRLDDASGPLPVLVELYSTICRESIPCTLVDVDVRQYQMRVRPEVTSRFAPYVFAGHVYRCGPFQVSLAADHRSRD